jgi:hypothetical protein
MAIDIGLVNPRRVAYRIPTAPEEEKPFFKMARTLGIQVADPAPYTELDIDALSRSMPAVQTSGGGAERGDEEVTVGSFLEKLRSMPTADSDEVCAPVHASVVLRVTLRSGEEGSGERRGAGEGK